MTCILLTKNQQKTCKYQKSESFVLILSGHVLEVGVSVSEKVGSQRARGLQSIGVANKTPYVYAYTRICDTPLVGLQCQSIRSQFFDGFVVLITPHACASYDSLRYLGDRRDGSKTLPHAHARGVIKSNYTGMLEGIYLGSPRAIASARMLECMYTQ